MRPGWGVRNQAVDKLLASATPIADDRIVFGITKLVRTAYDDDAELPDDLTVFLDRL